MPKIRTNRTKPPPEGFDEIEGILEEYTRKMRDGKPEPHPHPRPDRPSPPPADLGLVGGPAESESHEGKRKTESLWPIMRITHTRSRYIYDLYYKREAISKELCKHRWEWGTD